MPLLGFVAGVMLYSISSHCFWRALAYLAVFHFVRQPYGFLRIYSRRERAPRLFSQIDTIVIYGATLYPLLHWHLTAGRNFHWFVANDFWYFQSDQLLTLATGGYGCLMAVYVVKEVMLVIRTRFFNLPRVGVLLGTILSWYFGIVYFNGDLAFTLLNVVAHGIPYLALVWAYGEKQRGHATPGQAGGSLQAFTRYGVPLFMGVLFALAYLEEAFWDALVWQDHPQLFHWFYFFPAVHSPTLLSWLVPLLALPQVTHYVLDGFIWRISKNEPWKKAVLG